MFILKPIKNWFNNYDHYGVMAVSSMQAVFISISALIINFLFSPPHLSQLLTFGAGLLMVMAMESNFNKRLFNVILAGILSIAYSLLLSSVQNYRGLMLIIIALFIASIFAVSRRYPLLAGMVLIIHLNVYTAMIFPFAGNWNIFSNYLLSAALVIMIVALGIILFPPIYYLRVYLRSVHLLLAEFSYHFSDLAKHTENPDSLHHFSKMCNFSNSLTFKNQGINARRITISLINLHSFYSLALNNLVECSNSEFAEIALKCRELSQAISQQSMLKPTPFQNITAENKILYQLSHDFHVLTIAWNKICCAT